ncbi:MAG TPA: hypothetical protein VF665_06450 [Longimicrobium sp.]|jgi:hypothetical protein|uniref:hypothetical protein n=1 Tax=Longimicrobium sp. TaxID=2029185 RepID=UPI002ED9A00B
MWLLLSAVLAWAGGWRTLARHYPARAPGADRTIRGASASVGSPPLPVNYNNCLTVRVTEAGVEISVWPMFRFQHPPVFIPWSELEACEPGRRWLLYVVQILPRQGPPVMFRGRAARAVLAGWEAWGPRTAAA